MSKILNILLLAIISVLVLWNLSQTCLPAREQRAGAHFDKEFDYDYIFSLYNREDLIQKRMNYINMSNLDLIMIYDKPGEGDSLRDPCLVASLWSEKVKSVNIVSKLNPGCFNFIDSIELGVPEDLKNPFAIEWFLRNLKIQEFIYICDDYLPSKFNDEISDKFVYTNDVIKIHNSGDLAQYRTVKRLFEFGYKYFNVPNKIILHGPQVLQTELIAEAYNVLRIKDVSTDRSSSKTYSMLAAVGSLKTLLSQSVYEEPFYLKYQQLSRNMDASYSKFYCLNDGPGLFSIDEIKNMSLRLYNLSLNKNDRLVMRM